MFVKHKLTIIVKYWLTIFVNTFLYKKIYKMVYLKKKKKKGICHTLVLFHSTSLL